MSASSDMVARLALETRRLTEDLQRLRAERDRLERAIMLYHQLFQECFEGWQGQSNLANLLRQRLQSAEVWERCRETAEEMGNKFRVHQEGER